MLPSASLLYPACLNYEFILLHTPGKYLVNTPEAVRSWTVRSFAWTKMASASSTT